MAEVLSASVGSRQQNHERDVQLIQRLLNRRSGLTGIRLAINGKFDHTLEMAIIRFQREQMRLNFADGIIRPNDNTFWQLSEFTPVRMLAGALGGILLVPVSGKTDLVDEDYQRMASELFCEVPTLKAVHQVESAPGLYDTMGRPPILFERHIFSNLTFHQFDGKYPSISNPVPGGYHFPEEDQYRRLQQAFALNRDAALKAASWGGFQILGKNHAAAGYGTVTQFVQAMCRSVEEQCDAFVSYVKSDSTLWGALREKNWHDVAEHYNGKYFWKAKPSYDKRLVDAYAANRE
ncbi:MAG TPA: N-acetylmuramidase family protein [Edaphobacter sp.]|nr:N-acetylmuramidase family protein [Edaphobacter sp.]